MKSLAFGLYFVVIFAGSVFLTSDKFVDPINTPKLFFVAATCLVGVMIFATLPMMPIFKALSGGATLWGVSVVCLIQACYGLCQYNNWVPSNHSKFPITGSFDNPAGFAATLAMGFPISIWRLLHTKGIKRLLIIVALLLITIAMFCCDSRSGVLALAVSCVSFLCVEMGVYKRFQQFRRPKLLLILLSCVIFTGAILLYFHKKDSADGRLLIWRVSLEMINDNAALGVRPFQARYMDYQADYFKKHPTSQYAQLADNVKHPFNEFLNITVDLIGKM